MACKWYMLLEVKIINNLNSDIMSCAMFPQGRRVKSITVDPWVFVRGKKCDLDSSFLTAYVCVVTAALDYIGNMVVCVCNSVTKQWLHLCIHCMDLINIEWKKRIKRSFLGWYSSLLGHLILNITQNSTDVMINHTRMEYFKRGKNEGVL